MCLIFQIRVLKTPNEELWPGVSELPDYKPSFPQWNQNILAKHVPTLNAKGLDLMQVNITRRINFLSTFCKLNMQIKFSRKCWSTTPLRGSLLRMQWTIHSSMTWIKAPFLPQPSSCHLLVNKYQGNECYNIHCRLYSKVFSLLLNPLILCLL